MKNIYILICLSILFCGCDGVTEINIGPFKPVSNVDDIVMLGSSTKFVAFNYKTKQVEETYDFPKAFSGMYAYLSGHLVVSLVKDKFNIDIATGKISEHRIPNVDGFLLDDGKRIIEACTSSGQPGNTTYRYDVVENKIVEIINHPKIIEQTSFCFKQNGVSYWFSNKTGYDKEYENYIVSSEGKTFQIDNYGKFSTFIYRKNNFLVRSTWKNPDNIYNDDIEHCLEKIETITPLKTKAFFKLPVNRNDGIRETMMYGNKVLVFTLNGIYLLNETGSVIQKWVESSIENRSSNDQYKSYHANSNSVIFEDKLYVLGTENNNITNKSTYYCVEIDLITGKENWIALWND